MENTPQDLLSQNLDFASGTFYHNLYEKGVFDKKAFETFIDFVLQLHTSGIDENTRRIRAIELWELGFLIERLITCHFDKNDVYRIKNLKPEQIGELSKIIYYCCNWFSYEKEMETDCLKLGSW